MPSKKKTKIVKTIRIDVDKCHGCRACEMICSAFHAQPRYSSSNPARSPHTVSMSYSSTRSGRELPP